MIKPDTTVEVINLERNSSTKMILIKTPDGHELELVVASWRHVRPSGSWVANFSAELLQEALQNFVVNSPKELVTVGAVEFADLSYGGDIG